MWQVRHRIFQTALKSNILKKSLRFNARKYSTSGKDQFDTKELCKEPTSKEQSPSPPICPEPKSPNPYAGIPPTVEPSPCPPPPSPGFRQEPIRPPCPPPLTQVRNPYNPCNYVPPSDPDEYDLSRIKRKQCEYQAPDVQELPTFLKGGKSSVYFYHFMLILSAVLGFNTLYLIYQRFTRPI